MLLKLIVVCSFHVIVLGSDVFHVNSKITLHPDKESTYFGYTVLLTEMGLVVGAPKSKSRTVRNSFPGEVFTCPLEDLISSNITCNPLKRKLRSFIPVDYFVNDMWFGASIAAGPDGTLVVCSPRKMFTVSFREEISTSSCYVQGKKIEIALSPLYTGQKMFEFSGPPGEARKEYTDYYSRTNKQYRYKYHMLGLVGMAVTFTKDNEIVIGAPGILELAGTVFDYKYNPNSFTFDKSPMPNPYFIMDLGPDDYFGYSVESGIFEKNGQILFVGGAPRSKNGYGQVLIFEKPVKEMASLNVKAKLTGPHMGSYFGSSLCTPDLDMDGVNDLLVGAPLFAVKTDVLTYDQGAVFAYLTRKSGSGFELKEATVVRGSGDSGARFGTSIADLGDIDGDGFTDVAIGAPWENHGAGVVYIYRGSKNGLMPQYTQRIVANSAKGFGMSISKGYDVDKNGCNDLAIGAYGSDTAYLYRSIPTLQVLTSIKVPDLKNLKRDADNFTALFCHTVLAKALWPDVKLRLDAKVTVDLEGNRAKVIGKSELQYKITAKAGDYDICTDQIIEVNNQSDFSKPILIKFDVKPVDLDALPGFPSNSARLTENSILESSFLIQLLSCGDDLVCKPWLVMNVQPLESEYIPGVDSKLGVKITVTNKEEPAFGIKLHLVLPCPPKRVPDSCSLKHLDLMCDLPAPLKTNETVEWEIQLEYTWDGSDSQLMIAAELRDPLYMRNISEGAKEVVIPIVPRVIYNYSGIAQFNNTVYVTRNTLENSGDILFTHSYEVTNHGPSDIYNLTVEFLLSKEISPANLIEGSRLQENRLTFVPTNLKANGTMGYILPLRFNLSQYGENLKDLEVMNVTSKMLIYIHYGQTTENRSMEVTTHLVLEPTIPIWPLIVACVTGLVILAAIMIGFYKCGFFSRPKKEDLKQLIENNSAQDNPSGSSRNPSTSDDSSVQDIGH